MLIITYMLIPQACTTLLYHDSDAIRKAGQLEQDKFKPAINAFRSTELRWTDPLTGALYVIVLACFTAESISIGTMIKTKRITNLAKKVCKKLDVTSQKSFRSIKDKLSVMFGSKCSLSPDNAVVCQGANTVFLFSSRPYIFILPMKPLI